MSEQRTQNTNMPDQPPALRLKPYQTAFPETISGPEGDVILANITSDFRGMSSAHKKNFVPKKSVGSAYLDKLPDVKDLPQPGEALSSEKREHIINQGPVSELSPFMAGARMVLAERRAQRQHKKAQSSSRSVRVAHHVAESILEGKDYSGLDDELRPRTLRELAMAKRMGRLVRRANNSNHIANITKKMHAPSGKAQIADQAGSTKRKENLSTLEKLHRRSGRKYHDQQQKLSNKVIHGRVPVVGKGFSFEGLASGGPGNPRRKADKALAKRDKAIRKHEALKRAKER